MTGGWDYVWMSGRTMDHIQYRAFCDGKMISRTIEIIVYTEASKRQWVSIGTTARPYPLVI